MNVVADTNVWLRLADNRSSQHTQARESIVQLLSRDARVFLVPQNLVEFWAVATRPAEANGLGWSAGKAAFEVSRMRSRFELLPESERIFEKWFEVVQSEKISGKRVHDARLAVQLWVHGVSHLLTFNGADFAKFTWLSVLRPGDSTAAD